MTYEEAYTQYYHYLVKLVNNKRQPNHLKQDMLQVAKVGLALALESHDPSKGPFMNWLKIYVNKELFNFINDHSRTIRLPVSVIYDKEREPLPTEFIKSLDEPLLDSNEPLYSIIAYEVEEDTNDELKSFKTALLKLKPKYQKILTLRAEGKTVEEIGEVFGVSKQAISIQMETAINQIREILGINPSPTKKTRNVKKNTK